MVKTTNEASYDVLLTGQLLAGADKARAAGSLAKFLNTSPQKAQSLLKGQAKVIKKGINKDQALKYKALLTAHGIAVELTRAGAVAQAKKAAVVPADSKTQNPAKNAPVKKATAQTKSAQSTEQRQAKPEQKKKVTHISEA